MSIDINVDVSSSYHQEDVSSVLLLDSNALQSLNKYELKSLSNRGQLVVPVSVLAEVLCKKEKVRGELLDKLAFVKVFLTQDLTYYLNWELTHCRPAGLLLVDTIEKGSRCLLPERSARLVIINFKRLCKPGFSKQLEELIESPRIADNEYLRIVNALANDPNLLSSESNARTQGSRILDDLPSAFDYFERLVSERIENDIHAMTAREGVRSLKDRNWTVFRFRMLTYYYLVYVAASGVREFGKKVTNNRIDHSILSILLPQMTLITSDDRMRKIARAMWPDISLLP